MKILTIAKDKSNNLEYVLQHDITSYSYLFDGSDMTKPNKSQLIALLRAYLNPEDYDFHRSPSRISVFVDFMSYIRSQILSKVHGDTFGAVITQVLLTVIKKHIGCVIHVVFDILKGWSVRSGENMGLFIWPGLTITFPFLNK